MHLFPRDVPVVQLLADCTSSSSHEFSLNHAVRRQICNYLKSTWYFKITQLVYYYITFWWVVTSSFSWFCIEKGGRRWLTIISFLSLSVYRCQKWGRCLCVGWQSGWVLCKPYLLFSIFFSVVLVVLELLTISLKGDQRMLTELMLVPH